MEQWLEMQADRIEETLYEFGVMGQVYAGLVLPQVIVFHVQLGPKQRLREIQGLHEELALRLHVPGVLVSRQNGAIAIEVPRANPHEVTVRDVLATLQLRPPPHTALLGISNRGEQLMLFFPSPNVAHVLIAGMTGSGKTELMKTMLVSLSLWGKRQNTVVYLVDPKERKLAQLSGLWSVLQCCNGDQAPALLERLLQEMERRDAQQYNSPHIFVFIDELADLVMVGGQVVEKAITRLLQRGREAGIHIVAATQRPSAKIMAGLMRANFPVRISGAVNSALEASIATGIPRSGAERLLGRGDMLIIHRGAAQRFQACRCSEADLDGLGNLFEKHINKAPVVKGEPLESVAKLRERLNLRSPGRPGKPPTAEMILFAMTELAEKGECTQRALRRWHKEKHGTDVNPPRAVAAIEEAQRRMGLSSKGQGRGRNEIIGME